MQECTSPSFATRGNAIKNEKKYKPMKTLIYLLLCVCIATSAQTTLTGKVADATTQQAVPYANVYIDGTSKGTISDEDGFFELHDVELPANLVVSHLSYASVVSLVDNNSETDIEITMQPKVVDIDQVQVGASDNREVNLRRFKNGFLGRDYWGKNAIILNDSVLVFKREYQEEKRKVGNKDSIFLVLSKFEVNATSTLIIDMPELGYLLYADLSYYRETPNYTNSYGYYYYKPYYAGSLMKQKNVERNRQTVYYNSSHHFCRALHANRLLEEGYSINTSCTISSKNNQKMNCMASTAGLDTCFLPIDESLSAVMGQRDSMFKVEYYYNSRGEPLNLREKRHLENRIASKSYIYFSQDSCTFSKDGIIPGNGISFHGAMAVKRTGASLPRDYVVEK